MRRSLSAVLSLVCAAGSAAATTPSTAITTETSRVERQGRRAANFFWLPVEYWEAAARETGAEPEEVERIRKLFRDYLLVAVVDVEVSPTGKPEFRSIADIVGRSHFTRNGESLSVLKQVHPEFARTASDLVYVLRSSLASLGPGLHLLPLSNVDDEGRPVLRGAVGGELSLEFRFEPDAEPIRLVWRAPLTSIVGPKRCPEGGEELEADWKYCPHHGVVLP